MYCDKCGAPMKQLTCWVCDGDGMFDGETCFECGGKGDYWECPNPDCAFDLMVGIGDSEENE